MKTIGVNSILIIGLCILSCKLSNNKPTIEEIHSLKQELATIWELDQKYRNAAMKLREDNRGVRSQEEAELWAMQTEIDSVNMVRVQEIISKYGYPGKSLVGEELKSVAAYVILHNPKDQEKYLDLLWKHAEQENIDKREVAILEDRVLMFKGEKQMYGTAFKYDTISINPETGETLTKLRIWPIEEFKDLDKKRERVGWYSFKKQCEYSGISLEDFPEYEYQQNRFD